MKIIGKYPANKALLRDLADLEKGGYTIEYVAPTHIKIRKEVK